MTQISGFFGEHRWLSNFYLSPIKVDGILYGTVEHYFQAMKATNLDDHDYISTAPYPGLAKARAKTIELREDWNKVRLKKMRIGIRAKFDQNPELKEKLMATESLELIETNTWGDTFWGVSVDGKGHNHLGEILMELRDSYRMEKFYEQV